MKKIFLFLLAAMIAIDVSARMVTLESARTLARKFMAANTGKEDTLCLIGNNPFRHFFVFGSTETQGFIIVSADDRVIPVLGYSLNSKFDGFSDDMPSVKDWLKSYDDQIENLIQNHVEPTPELLKLWQTAGDGHVSQVGPLVTTKWAQGEPFNNLCPVNTSNGKNCATGCVATAMAQVMNYWEFPVHGEGSVSYSWKGMTLSENFENTYFDWQNMCDEYLLESSEAAMTAVATLMRSVGVATKMNYGGTSTTYAVSYGGLDYPCAENALKYTFHYSKNIFSAYYDNYGDSQWKQMMRDEVDGHRPVIYSGLSSYSTNVGHSFVLDGYDSDARFHINWGYNGNNDGFFAIGQLQYGNTFYNVDNKAVIHIEPDRDYNHGTSTIVTADAGTGGEVRIYGYGEDGELSVGDTVEIIAWAEDGYRFSRWSDNSKDNPRYLIADGKNYSYHAEYEELMSDTIAYCNDYMINATGGTSSATFEWGIIIPKSVYGKAFRLDELLYYPYMAGSYTVHVWEGVGNSETNELYEETFPVTASHQWVSLKFAQSVDLTNVNSDFLWIWLSSDFTGYPAVSGGYWPLTYTLFSGSYNGSVYRLNNGKWYAFDYSFMLKAICTDEMTITDGECRYRLHKGPNTAEVVDCEYSATVRDLTRSDGGVLHYESEVRIPDEIEYGGLRFTVTAISKVGAPQTSGNVAFHIPSSVKELDCSVFPQNSLLLFESNVSPVVRNVSDVTGCFITEDEIEGADDWNGHIFNTSYPYNVVGGTITQRPYFWQNLKVENILATGEFYNDEEYFMQNNLSTAWDFGDGITKVSSDDSHFEGTLNAEAVLEVIPVYDAVISGESVHFVYPKERMFRHCRNLTIEDGASYNVISFADGSGHKTVEAEKVKVQYSIDNAAFRYISLPFDCKVSDCKVSEVAGLPYLGIDLAEVTSLDADHWTAYEFDEGYVDYGEGCRNYSDSLSMKFRVVPSNGVLKAGRGYAVAVVESDDHIDTEVKATVSFESTVPVDFYSLSAQRESIDFEYSTNDRWYMRGWNLMGNPYWGTVSGSTFGKYVSKIEDDKVVEHNNDIEEIPVTAFEALYFQTATPGSRTLNPLVPAPAANVKPLNRELCDYITVELLSGDSLIGSTTVIDMPSASDEFVIEEDLSCMSSHGIASVASGVRCRFNELSLVGDTVVVPLSVNVVEGQYSIDYDRSSRLPYADIMLKDYSDGSMYEIAEMPLTFNMNDGSRYALLFSPHEVISSVEQPDGESLKVVVLGDRITVSGIDAGEKVELYDISGRMISSAIAGGDVVGFDIPVRGVYIVNSGGRVVKALCGR